MRRITESRADKSAAIEPAVASAAPAVASDHVLAFVSLARIAAGDGGAADVLALSSNLIGDIMPAVSGGWYLPDSGRTRLTVADAFGPSAHVLRGLQIGVGQKLTGWVAASRQPVVNSDAALDLESAAERGNPALRSCMSVPLLAGDVLVGVLSLYAGADEPFDENRCRLVQMIAPHVAGAILAAQRNASPASDLYDRATGTGGRDLRLVSNR
jgi:GAF domain-containing protein